MDVNLSALTPRRRHQIFLSYVGVMVLVFLLPVPATPLEESRYADKLVHFGIFLGFAMLFYLDRHRGAGWTFLISVVFAAGIELIQSTLPYRGGDWLDFAAGTAGAAAGALFMRLVERRVPP